LERRVLGRTNLEVSVFGFGGFLLNGTSAAEASEIVAEAVERGINYFDVAPSYGNSESRLGPALEEHRDRVVLACKTQKRTREEAAAELRSSLATLRADHFDVYQLHALDNPDEIKVALGPGGALEAILEARDQGLVRYIGFSAHHQQSALALMERFDFDTVLFPVNWVYWLKGNAGRAVVHGAAAHNRGVIAMKALAHRKWRKEEESTCPNCWYRPLDSDPELASMALRFALSQPVHVAVSPADAGMLRLGIDLLDRYKPITDDEVEALQRRAQLLEPIFSTSTDDH